jgi:branched-chain amino acid transport system ATP-binding protein
MLLEVQSVTKRFGGLVALKNVSLYVNSQEIVGIIGPNGAGKTTLFNVITGVYKPDSGSVTFNGEDITGLKPHEICARGIARTFQLTRPFNELTVFENVLVGALLKSKTLHEAEQKTIEILKSMGLLHRKDVLSKDLNIIERKRLEFARALATEPKLLLLDEVMAGLRASEIVNIIEAIKELRSKGITIMIIEHVIKGVMQVSDRVVVLHSGEKIAEGKPEEIQENKAVRKAYLGEEYVSA